MPQTIFDAVESPTLFQWRAQAEAFSASETMEADLTANAKTRSTDLFVRPGGHCHGLAHPIPADLEAVKVLTTAPALLDLFMWLSYRCFVARAKEMIPLFGPFGLASQIGSIEYARPRRFREKLDAWLESIRVLWPECLAKISKDGTSLEVNRATAILDEQKACG